MLPGAGKYRIEHRALRKVVSTTRAMPQLLGIVAIHLPIIEKKMQRPHHRRTDVDGALHLIVRSRRSRSGCGPRSSLPHVVADRRSSSMPSLSTHDSPSKTPSGQARSSARMRAAAVCLRRREGGEHGLETVACHHLPRLAARPRLATPAWPRISPTTRSGVRLLARTNARCRERSRRPS